MECEAQQQATRAWTTRRDEKKRRMQLVSSWMSGPVLRQEKLVEALELLIAPADRIVLEGDNQKQADFLSRCLVMADPKKLHDLHLIPHLRRSHRSCRPMRASRLRPMPRVPRRSLDPRQPPCREDRTL
jgi:hypothetical protein